ncbi:hydroxymethylglutaryl-CoA reductase [Sphingobacterium anhuiense]|uniref:hydroxymethylglutaryl-CoA reductase n=1 Tax=Sphingobacterium anhuiense TaxID=493780 RepID=UPI003C2E29F6
MKTLLKKTEAYDVHTEDACALPFSSEISQTEIAKLCDYLTKKTNKQFPILTDSNINLSLLNGNIENFIGISQIPTGVIGPLKVHGTAANGAYYVPLATSEGALVASYHRGARACLLAGGITSICLKEGIQRSPVFKFENLNDLSLFISWFLAKKESLHDIVKNTSRFAKLTDTKIQIEGNHLTISFEYFTADASGQNMVTICTDAICRFMIDQCPVKPSHWFIEGNSSGDKKATAYSFNNVRGKKVTAEIELSAKIVSEVLKTSSALMDRYWRTSTMGVIQSGAIGAQGHYANGLTALFIATGQDVACVAEAATGITRMELNSDGSLYACVTLPNLIVGTVGGGTNLPTQRECLDMMDCYGEGNSIKYAEIAAALVLAGELSIAAALSAGQFTQAHQKFGRKKSL